MRKIPMIAVLFLTGCCCPGMNTTGWNFSVGKAPMVYAPAMVSASAPMYGIAPVGAYPAVPPPGPVAPRMMSMPTPVADPCQPAGPPLRAAAPPTSRDCTCEELLGHLKTIETRLGLMERAPLKLPKAE